MKPKNPMVVIDIPEKLAAMQQLANCLEHYGGEPITRRHPLVRVVLRLEHQCRVRNLPFAGGRRQYLDRPFYGVWRRLVAWSNSDIISRQQAAELSRKLSRLLRAALLERISLGLGNDGAPAVIRHKSQYDATVERLVKQYHESHVIPPDVEWWDQETTRIE